MTSERTNQKIQAEQAGGGGQGEAQVGGDFTLTDQNGKTVHAADFRGRVMLVFFGFTHCPDICPIAVATLSKAMGLLGAQADQVAPVFISVDPGRDTPPVLKDYLSNFDKRMVGLTGTPEQIRQVTQEYKVYAAKEPPAQGSDGMHSGMNMGYNVDHSAFIYLMGRDGKFIRVFPNNADAAEITRTVQHVLAR